MSTRKIKNARDLESNELIYFKSHAQATFMSDGSTVEDVINGIKETGGADLTDYVTTTQLNTSLSGKQDTISDLADIRSGASKGATAVQPASVATAVTINGVNKTISSNKINIGTIPTAVTINDTTKTGSTIALGTVVTSVTVNDTTKTGSTIALGTVVTGVTMNGSTKTGSTVALGTVVTGVTMNGSTKTGSTVALGTVVTGVTMNGSAKTVSNGKVDLGTIITAHQTLKTINGESIIGSGNIEISGGGSSDANVQAVETGDVLDDVNVNYATTAYVDGLIGDINSVLESIISSGGSVSLITFTIAGTEYKAEEGMTWGDWIKSTYNPGGFEEVTQMDYVYYTSILGARIKKSDGSFVLLTDYISEASYIIYNPDL